MTVKLNLTIDEKIVAKSKRLAAKRNTTVSKMVQDLLQKQLEQDEKKPKEKSFVEKYAGILSGKFSADNVEKLRNEHLSKKYGY